MVTRESQRSTEASYVHGSCLAQCEIDGVRVDCSEPSLSATGLETKSVCGMDLPKVATLNFQDFVGISTTLLMSVTINIVSISLQRLHIRHTEENIEKRQALPDWSEVIGAVLQTIIQIAILRMAFSILNGTGSTCRFVILASPLQFAPFLAAYTAVIPVAASTVGMIDDVGDRESLQKLLHGLKSTGVYALGSKGFVMAVVTLLFILNGLLQLVFVFCITIVTFWAVFAYIHIFVVMLAMVGLPAVFFGGTVLIVEGKLQTGEKADELEAHEARAKRARAFDEEEKCQRCNWKIQRIECETKKCNHMCKGEGCVSKATKLAANSAHCKCGHQCEPCLEKEKEKAREVSDAFERECIDNAEAWNKVKKRAATNDQASKELGAKSVLIMVMSAAVVVAASFSFFFTHSFLLYATGDWMLFHDAFFGAIAAPRLPTFPNFDFMFTFNFNVFWDVWMAILNMDIEVPTLLFEASLQISLLQILYPQREQVREDRQIRTRRSQRRPKEAQAKEQARRRRRYHTSSHRRPKYQK
eukprot:TRINITY_DN3840_c0_g4_i3.p1 TRINITY_DN3840_c0_g4~~TRINITY_DN3840_c0_g4_i3.p1  ORF type:complete len:529 (+),score=81.59 TRINITY_DN3840_c0_g4_i3:653-2239(+)